ncbi:NADPH-dependent F420 reductase [Tahibacter sp. UC22_41]|uniref:NADPH-dependent F420 reductase n=1 Tax=Tahibacter sp. UC22_41 TaxID=3350178 RepID=UPI0036D88D54
MRPACVLAGAAAFRDKGAPSCEQHTMNIGIVGAGQIGSTLARRLGECGHVVRLANSRGIEAVRPIADEAGAQATDVADALCRTQLVILAIPERRIRRLPRATCAGIPADTIVVDAGNYYPGAADEAITEIEAGMPHSEWVARRIGRPVIKAFNTMLAQSLDTKARPATAAGRIALPVAGDDSDAKRTVMALIDQLGFDAVGAGSLAASWRQQPGTPACCTDLDAAALRQALLGAERHQIAPRLAQIVERIGGLPQSATSDDLVRISRSVHGLALS